MKLIGFFLEEQEMMHVKSALQAKIHLTRKDPQTVSVTHVLTTHSHKHILISH